MSILEKTETQISFYYNGVNMIKGITGGRYITVSGGSSSDPYISPGAMGAGMVRYNSNMNCMEVNDGNSWRSLGFNYANLELTPEAQAILDWAKKKMVEEKQIDELCEKYPGLRKARDNYEAFLALVQSESVSESI
jgi:hypothetical protein